MNKNYPAQIGPYKVKVKSNQTTDRWLDYSMARCQISVGQEYHEGSKLVAMLDWSIDRFDDVQICVNDTLQRFNLMFEKGLSEKNASYIAQRVGDEWIERNSSLWRHAQNVSIIRWDKWLEDEYTAISPKTAFLYANNPEFKEAIDRNISDIWERRKHLQPHIYKPEAFPRFSELSKQYLLEEITAFSIMYEKDEAIDIYPGTAIFAATVFQGREIAGAPPGLGKGHFCRVDFSKNRNYQPNLEPELLYG